MIQQSTGKGKNNKSVNVIVLQLLLNDISIVKIVVPAGTKQKYSLDSGAKGETLAKLKVDGINVPELISRIEIYQQAKKMKDVDGWVGVGGKTIKALMEDANPQRERMAYVRKKIPCTLCINAIGVQTILSLYDKQYNRLTPTNQTGLKYILTTAKTDKDLASIAEFAYMLATTKHETAHTFRGIEEYGKGAGKTYGTEITITDPATKKKYKNKYYGRGFVQLTWGFNYQRLDEKLGNGVFPNKNKTKAADFNKGFTISKPSESIYLNPKKALDNIAAYTGLVWAMQKGIYTTKKIGDYVNTSTIDYFNARRVINGTDKASEIAGYAENIEIILRSSAP